MLRIACVFKEKRDGQNENSAQNVLSGAYMSAEQLEFFRTLLEVEKSTLLENVQKTLDYMQGLEPVPDANDRASVEEEYRLELRVRNRERKLLKKIDEALLRIKQGTYGWCEETGEPIGIPRLLARPTAALCIEAQERREQMDRFQW
ncbi:MAG: RNA polymerase-binding protein DksA [Nitrosomonas sp.]|nr:RNA polymerase-binding protein DksA [Nitrosomonas sp.]